MTELLENIRNGKCQLINKNWITKDLVEAKDVYQSINECHVFTEQDLFTNTISIEQLKQAVEEIESHKYDEGAGFDDYSDGYIKGLFKAARILRTLIVESEG